jgi:ABC-type nitrate/sulfonate/bicarbonate transport system permease component
VTALRQAQDPGASELAGVVASAQDNRGRRGSGFPLRLIGWAVIVLLIVVWQLASSLGWYSTPILPSPLQIAQRWISLSAGGTLWPAIGNTLWDTLSGFLIGSLAGVIIGVAMARIPIVAALLEPVVELIRPIPIVAIVPLLILFLGIGDQLKVFSVALAAVFPVLIATVAAVASVPLTMRQTAQTFGLGPLAATIRVHLPTALPTIAVGIKTALSLSIVIAVLSEMIAGNDGIGYLVINAQQTIDVTALYAQVVTLGIIGYLLNLGFRLLVRYAIPWSPEEQLRRSR